METKKIPSIDDKCRFFAQYWGTKTLYVGGVGLVKIGIGGWNLKHPDFFLELKPLSKITNEDLLFICKNRNGKIESIELLGIKESKGISHLNIKTHFSNGWNDFYITINEIENIDYLRSKGYALPFMGYSVEDLVSFGWVRVS